MIQGVPTTPLIEACHNGNIIAVQELVSNGEDVNQADSLQRFPLYTAVLWMKPLSRVSIIRILLAAGASPNIRPPRIRYQIIKMACEIHRDDVIPHLLIDYGATWPEGIERHPTYKRIISQRTRLKQIASSVMLMPPRSGGMNRNIRKHIAKHLWSMRFE